MKLHVVNSNSEKVYLKIIASTRRELARAIGRGAFSIAGESYDVNDVSAESETTNTAVGAIIATVIGLLGGPIGVLSGGTIGGLIGNSSDREEANRESIFNNSHYEV